MIYFYWHRGVVVLTLRDADAGTVTMVGTSLLPPLILPLCTAHQIAQQRHIRFLSTKREREREREKERERERERASAATKERASV